MKDRIKAWRQSAGVWLNAMLLVAFPYTDQILQGVSDYLPSLAPYLPANVYKWVGLVVVVANVVRAARRARPAAAKEVAHG
ncbi:hypothetical protein HH212_26115 [Massilia forsythiae]|uniref:Holin n=1 Tax=Massilia forsythiae TaxID=2728020 RepID=A0A7Z2W261_9BURK|nr:hypothetical protein [Massilia forsythiae]QJE03035.1 hypothetical protein HH212_26115 [Massilia forsythiae]